MGKAIVYQGTNARAYRVPRDPQSAGQLGARSFFRDVTRMIQTGNLFMRGACRTVLGDRWFTTLYKLTSDRWAIDDEVWEGLGPAARAEMNEKAPYQETAEEAGRVWTSIINAMSNTDISWLGLPDFDGYTVDQRLEWWNRDLEDVNDAGVYENDSIFGVWSGTWETVVNSGALGGSYLQKTGGLVASLNLYWWGKQLRLFYRKASDQGSADYRSDTMTFSTFSMYDAVESFENVFSTELSIEGLHRFAIGPRLVGGVWGLINIDRIEIL
jgi:hypothetical protein